MHCQLMLNWAVAIQIYTCDATFFPFKAQTLSIDYNKLVAWDMGLALLIFAVGLPACSLN